MSPLERLAGALGRNDEQPNVALAEELAARPNQAAIGELVAALSTAPAAVRADAIKVLYELGERRPELLAPHAEAFFPLIAGKNNRLVWGGLSALAAVAAERADLLAARLPEIIAAADKGSVIANDKTMVILVTLAAHGHDRRALPILFARLEAAPDNQFPMYAEIALPVIASGRVGFREILETRLARGLPPAKHKRVEKVLKKLG